MMGTQQPLKSGDVRSRILAAATRLVSEGGVEAVTTRAVAEAAAVQAPTIYRLFGDKAGLLNALAEQTLAEFVATKARRKPSADPVSDLREAWDDYIAFNLANPAVFIITTSRPTEPSSAADAGQAVLAAHVRRIAAAGRLRVAEERAVDLIHAMGMGVVLAMLPKPPQERKGLSRAARDAVFAAVIGDVVPNLRAGSAGAASALRARLDEATSLSPAERSLMDEWLGRLAQQG